MGDRCAHWVTVLIRKRDSLSRSGLVWCGNGMTRPKRASPVLKRARPVLKRASPVREWDSPSRSRINRFGWNRSSSRRRVQTDNESTTSSSPWLHPLPAAPSPFTSIRVVADIMTFDNSKSQIDFSCYQIRLHIHLRSCIPSQQPHLLSRQSGSWLTDCIFISVAACSSQQPHLLLRQSGSWLTSWLSTIPNIR